MNTKGLLERIVRWLHGEPRMPEKVKPERKLLPTPCPWCEGPMLYVGDGFFHGALCESDECGFASRAALTSTLAHNIVAQRGKRPNRS